MPALLHRAVVKSHRRR